MTCGLANEKSCLSTVFSDWTNIFHDLGLGRRRDIVYLHPLIQLIKNHNYYINIYILYIITIQSAYYPHLNSRPEPWCVVTWIEAAKHPDISLSFLKIQTVQAVYDCLDNSDWNWLAKNRGSFEEPVDLPELGRIDMEQCRTPPWKLYTNHHQAKTPKFVATLKNICFAKLGPPQKAVMTNTCNQQHPGMIWKHHHSGLGWPRSTAKKHVACPFSCGGSPGKRIWTP